MSRRPSDPTSTRQTGGSAPAVPALSVWACGQQAEQTVLREGGYLPGTARDRGRMPPGVAATAIAAYSKPGQIVCDPDCGAGTVLVEALRAGRHAVGRPLGRGWWRIARGNVTAAKRAGALADGTVLAHPAGWSADRTAGIAGRVQLVLTALRPRTGTADRTTPPPSPTGSTSRVASGWEPDEPADINRCLDRLVSTLAGVVPLLHPDGHVIVTVPPTRRADQTLADVTGGLLAAAGRIGLIPIGRCVAITAQIRGHRLITRAGLDERRAAHRARAAHRPVCLAVHHDVWIFQSRLSARGVAAQPRPDRPPPECDRRSAGRRTEGRRVTARLYCRDCGWHPTYRRKKAALRAARRHRCLPPMPGSIPPSRTRPTSTPTDTSLTDRGSTESDDPEAEMPDSSTPSDHHRHGDHRAGSDHADTSAAWPRRLLAAVAGHPEPADPARYAADSGSPAGARLRVAALAAYHTENAQRARATITALVQAGYHVGPVPFGYRARHTEPESVGHRRRRRVRLMMEPVEAATVAMIFTWRVTDGLSRAEIVHRLAGARYPAPLHPVTARPVTWSPAIVATILRNPTYTGRTVWGRWHAGRPVAPTRWVTSAAGAHLAVVDDATFLAAQPSEPLRTELAIAWRRHQPQRADGRDSVRTDGNPSRAA